MKVNWLYVDFNSYFASVEQHLNPRIRGKPVAVVPMLADTTCVIAASYEAKKFGIKTGTRVGEAKRMCPGLILKTGQHGEYVNYHKLLIEVIESCHPVTAVASIDEVACALNGRDRNIENAVSLAKEIKNKIYQNIGESFSCSIGLAPNRFLAKVASDMQKPNGLVTILREDLPHKLFQLKLQDLIGIGPRMAERLNKSGVYTVEKLYACSIDELRRIWGGIGGERFYKWLRGEDIEIIHNENQSIGHSHVLPPIQRNPKDAYQVGHKLLHKAAVRLRKLGSWTRHMAIGVRNMDNSSTWGELKMLECQDTFTLQEAFEQIWRTLLFKKPLKVSVTLSHLVHENERTFSFFENPKRERLSHTIDALNSRFGKNTIYLGSIHESLDSAPTRIAFSSIPDIENF
ncbi:MAG: hypothetical protein A2Z20_08845 [Bdellovibrionales bacterium RBG_16_40_8]|nr:MAG: hypothetical protein A2Z20_08845 [Bdellovibrionales bacterium RBG_16_40_8]